MDGQRTRSPPRAGLRVEFVQYCGMLGSGSSPEAHRGPLLRTDPRRSGNWRSARTDPGRSRHRDLSTATRAALRGGPPRRCPPGRPQGLPAAVVGDQLSAAMLARLRRSCAKPIISRTCACAFSERPNAQPGGANISPATGVLPCGPHGSNAELPSCDLAAIQPAQHGARHGAALRTTWEVRSRTSDPACGLGDASGVLLGDRGLYEQQRTASSRCWACWRGGARGLGCVAVPAPLVRLDQRCSPPRRWRSRGALALWPPDSVNVSSLMGGFSWWDWW